MRGALFNFSSAPSWTDSRHRTGSWRLSCRTWRPRRSQSRTGRLRSLRSFSGMPHKPTGRLLWDACRVPDFWSGPEGGRAAREGGSREGCRGSAPAPPPPVCFCLTPPAVSLRSPYGFTTISPELLMVWGWETAVLPSGHPLIV